MTNPDTSPRTSRGAVAAAFAATYTIWGSTYLAIKLAIDSVPPFLMAGARFFLAGAILYVIARRRSATRERLTWVHWRSALIIGACLLLAGNGIAALCQQKFARVSGLCVGFLPVLAAAVHNWLYGGALVLFTATATHPGALVMPPSAYAAALAELIHLDQLHVLERGEWIVGGKLRPRRSDDENLHARME